MFHTVNQHGDPPCAEEIIRYNPKHDNSMAKGECITTTTNLCGCCTNAYTMLCVGSISTDVRRFLSHSLSLIFLFLEFGLDCTADRVFTFSPLSFITVVDFPLLRFIRDSPPKKSVSVGSDQFSKVPRGNF